MKDKNRLLYLVLFVMALAINFAGINVKFFTDDPALYASIAKNLAWRHGFFELYTYNQNWLDKPHFPFWMILASFKIFGISAWAYRLPALLFFVLSLLYTFLFARKYYGWETAAAAVLILMTSLQVLLSNTDVRAEPYLMALITGSIYHIACLKERFTFTALLLAALLTACAIMTKGIFVVAAIYGALLGHLLLSKNLKGLFRWRWLLLLVLTFIFTLPELYALYTQFDLHPEKTVFGIHHVSGIKWFLWDSQFGRFVNNGPITRQASGSIFFFVHTLLWAFAPWCLLFYYAVYRKVRDILKKRPQPEYYSITGGLLLLILFSLSRFQLPFYTNAVFPLFAVITAPACLEDLSGRGKTYRLTVQWTYVVLLTATVIGINLFLMPVHDNFFGVDCVIFGIMVLVIPANVTQARKKAFFFSCSSALFTGFFLNTIFYKQITPYKGQTAAAEYVNLRPFDRFPIYSLKFENNLFQFYCKRPVGLVPIAQFDSFNPGKTAIFYANQQSMDYLRHAHARFNIIHSFINYPQENILPKFLDKKIRTQVLDHVYLISK